MITVTSRYGVAVPDVKLPPPIVSVSSLTDDQRERLMKMLKRGKAQRSATPVSHTPTVDPSKPRSRWGNRQRQRQRLLAENPHCGICGCELTLETYAPGQLTVHNGQVTCRTCHRDQRLRELQAAMAVQTRN